MNISDEIGNIVALALSLKKVQIDYKNGMLSKSELSDSAGAASVEMLRSAMSLTKFAEKEHETLLLMMSINEILEKFNKDELLSFDINEN